MGNRLVEGNIYRTPLSVFTIFLFRDFASIFPSSLLGINAHPHIHILVQGWAMMGPPHHDILQVRRSKKRICSRSLRLVLSYCLALRMG